MSTPKAIILGWINEGNTPQCGETVKNQHIIAQLRNCGYKVITLDFYQWKRHPWVILKFFLSLLLYPKTPLILSTAPKNVYFIMKWHKWLHSKRRIIQWVIGGNIHRLIREGALDPKYISALHCNIVETLEMVDWMNQDNVTNVIHTPNFKPIPYKPTLVPNYNETKKFLFISRIKPEKGVDYIIEAIKMLNSQGYGDKFSVDFYGRIDEDYKEIFTYGISLLPNAEYKGFLNIASKNGYDTLASYTAMLFPTFWISEGFAGIFIDSFIAGLPIIATDWAHNFTILEENETGIKIQHHDAKAIAEAMSDIITGKIDIETMRHNCQREADKYDSTKIITNEYLKKVGIY